MKTHIEAVNYSDGAVNAYGSVANAMLNGRRAKHRVFLNKDGDSCINVYQGDISGKGPKDPANWKVAYAKDHGITTYGTLRREEWLHLDRALLGVRDYRLGGVMDLVDMGLTYDVNGMGTTVLEYHDVSDAFESQMSMDALSRGPGDKLEYTSTYLPLPIIYVDFDINERILSSSRALGSPLDTSMVERAGRRVIESVENLLFTDETYSFGSGTIYSYLNHPKRNTYTLHAKWNDTGATADKMVSDVLTMKQTLINNRYFGPYKLYIPTAYETVIDADYDKQTPGTTIRERIEKISGLSGIKVIDSLPIDTMLLVQLTSDVVRLVRGMEMQILEWGDEGGLSTHYKVMTIQVPQLRVPQPVSGKTQKGGWIHANKA